MLIVPAVVRMGLMNSVVEATHSLQTTTGGPRPMATISPEALKSAALVALMIVTGETVISDDERIVVRAPERHSGPFVVS